MNNNSQYAEATKSELEEMRALIPRKGTALPERTRRNKLVRERLPNLRHETVVILALFDRYALSFGELEFRLTHKRFNFAQIVDLMFALSCITYTKRVQRFFSLATSCLKTLGPTVPYEQISQKYWEYERVSPVSSNLAEILKEHTDYPGRLERPE